MANYISNVEVLHENAGYIMRTIYIDYYNDVADSVDPHIELECHEAIHDNGDRYVSLVGVETHNILASKQLPALITWLQTYPYETWNG